MSEGQDDHQDALRRAIGMLGEALDLLDAAGAPPEAGAHVELAIVELRRVLSDPESATEPGA